MRSAETFDEAIRRDVGAGARREPFDEPEEQPAEDQEEKERLADESREAAPVRRFTHTQGVYQMARCPSRSRTFRWRTG
jgi:hypothetical protein